MTQILLVAMAIQERFDGCDKGNDEFYRSRWQYGIILMVAMKTCRFSLVFGSNGRKSRVSCVGGVGLVFLVFAVASKRANKGIGGFWLVGD